MVYEETAVQPLEAFERVLSILLNFQASRQQCEVPYRKAVKWEPPLSWLFHVECRWGPVF